MQSEPYFTHAIDSATKYCVGCGRFLMDLQERTVWRGNIPTPVCAEITAISHIVRKK